MADMMKQRLKYVSRRGLGDVFAMLTQSMLFLTRPSPLCIFDCNVLLEEKVADYMDRQNAFLQGLRGGHASNIGAQAASTNFTGQWNAKV